MFFVVYLLLFSSLCAQEINFFIKNLPLKKAVFLEIIGEKVNAIDTVLAQENKFNFSLNGKHSGLYRLKLDEKHFLNFVYDNEIVEIKTDYNRFIDSLKIIKSKSNQLYYDFLRINRAYKTKSELLNLVLYRYPQNDDYYKVTQQKLVQVQNDYLNFVNNVSQKNSDTFIARYIYSSQLPVVESSLSVNAQNEYLRKHALDKVNFNDATLCYSDLFTNKAVEYLFYYRDSDIPKNLLEKEFTLAVDTLMNKAKTNKIVLKQITDYLINGFREYGFDSILDYIIDRYVIKYRIPIEAKLESSLQRRIDQARFLSVGSIAPEISLKDTSGNLVTLSKVNAEKILIVFYASWCSHCQKSVSQIVKLYNSQREKTIEIFGVSLDKKREDWVKFIKDYKINWINVSDLKGWNGKIVRNYFIYATPTMFLIDNKRKILSKPITINDVKKIFDEK